MTGFVLQVSGLVSSVADDGVVSDDQGARFVLRGAPVPSLSSNASSKLLASLASGFGKVPKKTPFRFS